MIPQTLFHSKFYPANIFSHKKTIKPKEVNNNKQSIIELRQNAIHMQEFDVCRLSYDELKKWRKDVDKFFFKRQFDGLMSHHYYFRMAHHLDYDENVVRLIKLHLLLMIRQYKEPFMLTQAKSADPFWEIYGVKMKWGVNMIRRLIIPKRLKENKIAFGVLSNREAYRVSVLIRTRSRSR